MPKKRKPKKKHKAKKKREPEKKREYPKASQDFYGVDYWEIQADSAEKLGNHKKAVWAYERLAEIWKRKGNKRKFNLCWGKCMLNKGKVLFDKKYASAQDFKSAMGFFREAAEHFEIIDEKPQATWARARASEGEYRVAKRKGNLKSMIGALEDAVRLFEQTNDKLGLLVNQGDLAKYRGTLQVRQKDYLPASEAFLSAKEFYEDAARYAHARARSKDKGRFEKDAKHASALSEFSKADAIVTAPLPNTRERIEEAACKYESASPIFAELGNFPTSNLCKQLAQLLRDILANKAEHVKKTLLYLSNGKIELSAHEWDRLRSMIELTQILDWVNATTIVSNDITEMPARYEDANYKEISAESKSHVLGYEIVKLLVDCNDIWTSRGNEEIFKPTSTMIGKLADVGKPVRNETDFRNLIDALFQIVYEGSATLDRIPRKLRQDDSIGFTIKHLRVGLFHDLEHGDERNIARKKIRLAEIYKRYTGKTTLSSLKPEDFPGFQLKVLLELRTFLEDLKQCCITNEFS